ncbi:MAG: hypothetical protein JKY13_01130 [Gammaproteobacteria bacterium]|nr:hypothetical protein [Gammaproteobacteria bacterium]
MLFSHTLNGYKKMPAKGGCQRCSNIQVMAAVKYMVERSKTHSDYTLW